MAECKSRTSVTSVSRLIELAASMLSPRCKGHGGTSCANPNFGMLAITCKQAKGILQSFVCSSYKRILQHSFRIIELIYYQPHIQSDSLQVPHVKFFSLSKDGRNTNISLWSLLYIVWVKTRWIKDKLHWGRPMSDFVMWNSMETHRTRTHLSYSSIKIPSKGKPTLFDSSFGKR